MASEENDDEIKRACAEEKSERIPSYLSMGRDVFQSSFSSGDMSREQELMHASNLSDSQSSAIKVEVRVCVVVLETSKYIIITLTNQHLALCILICRYCIQ